MSKNENKSRTRLWTVLAVLNVVGVALPLIQYLQSDGDADAGRQIFAAVVLVCVVLLFLVVDGVTALLVNFDVSQL